MNLLLVDEDKDGDRDIKVISSNAMSKSLITLFEQSNDGQGFVMTKTQADAIPTHESLHSSQWVAEGLIDADEHVDALYVSPGIFDGELDNDVQWSRHDGVDRGLLYVRRAK